MSQWGSMVLYCLRQTQDCRTTAFLVPGTPVSFLFHVPLGGKAQIFEMHSAAGFSVSL